MKKAKLKRARGTLAEYNSAKIEGKWQKKWQSSKLYSSKENSKKEKFYVLDMFPYPSGEGLHVGHPKGYIATDIISRFKRMNDYSVLHPMGFDAFGLPAENYAIKTKTNPADSVKKNVARYKKQLEILGFDYDWSREVNTTDPKYYKWTQWIFLKLLEKGLAYESFEPINWCPVDKTGLANEDVEDGHCERCGTLVEKKPMRQWVLKITDYAERLLNDLEVRDINDTQLLIDSSNEPCFMQVTEPGTIRKDLPFVERKAIIAIVKHWSLDKYIGLVWKKVSWKTFITGGVESNQTVEEAAIREVREETGFQNIKFIKNFGKIHSKFFHVPKQENRFAHFDVLYLELQDDESVEISDIEKSNHEVRWLSKEEMSSFITPEAQKYAWAMFLGEESQFISKSKNLLDWPESIKTSQKNWIGRSEGAEIRFKVNPTSLANRELRRAGSGSQEIKVFTTRPDTLFGVTYIVLAPEHALVSEFLSIVENKNEVEDYIAKIKNVSEIDRTDAKKEKTGVELKGIKAINPVNKEEVSVWIADYVLPDYGTGAVMAVPAHDDRDWAFAKKFGLSIKEVVIPKIIDKRNPPVEGKAKVERRNIHAIVRNPKDGKILCLKWKQHPWTTFPMGGVEQGEDLIEAGKREVLEETGYKNLTNGKVLGGTVWAEYFAAHKDQNRISFTSLLTFDLANEEKVEVDKKEQDQHEIFWASFGDLTPEFMTHAEMPIWLERLGGKVGAYTESGVLINSTQFNGRKSEEVMKEITTFAGGTWVTKYKLRDWVFSRQRYWGEPIPVIHCENCKLINPAGGGIVPVPEKDLPVVLPKVKSYEPTGTGDSPLAAISKWVNVKCPVCKGKAKRETNTMPQWAGSSWYYLRYMDSKNSKKLVDSKKEKYWSPVDTYVGGAEHATRHLIYARFWHKFLYDIGIVSSIEPFLKLQHVGLIMGEDGRKMSKRFGNVVNPDEIVKNYGADSLRLYEMFMGPFDQQISWSTASISGVRRFIEKVWKLREKIDKSEEDTTSLLAGSELRSAGTKIIHKTIKKVSEDIEGMRFNTAISAMMIAVNDLEKLSKISKENYQLLLQLLAPFAPHFTEELWSNLGNKKSIHISKWPKYEANLIVDDEVTIMVQVNGKIRGSFVTSVSAEQSELENKAKELEEVKKWIEGKNIIKVIVVPKRLINIVVA